MRLQYPSRSSREDSLPLCKSVHCSRARFLQVPDSFKALLSVRILLRSVALLGYNFAALRHRTHGLVSKA